MKVLYTDLDGTMVGPYGNFFAAEDRTPTLAPARALLELHRAGVALVPVSGRTRVQLQETALIFGADGYIAELGAVVAWDHGREASVRPGAMPSVYSGQLPIDVLASLGLPEALFERWPGLEWHSPWHRGHEADAMLRGIVDVAEVERWLAGQGLDWLRMRDNGVLPGPAGLHIYHLMPDGLSKGGAVEWDLARRGLTAADAVAVGDSASDLGMAPYVSRMWITANGASNAHMTPLIEASRAAGHDVRVTTEPVGVGWAEAVLASL